ncbi:MAG: hypothetical protein JW915_17760 [Chitinispirillaceae bacterium]|nr:hypothetical protein [Chitinispirillaceae bacterium]
MSEQAVPHVLIRNIIGTIPDKKKLVIQGITSGITCFLIFEMFSVVNTNVPRFPVPWLLMIIVPIAEMVFFSRIVSILRMPRRDDLFFIYGLDYNQRQSLALTAFHSAQTMLRSFTLPLLVTALTLEITVLHLYSIWEIVVPAVALTGLLCFFPWAGKLAFEKGFFRPVKTDRMPGTVKNAIPFSETFSSVLIVLGTRISSLVPVVFRPIVLRNVFILFRSEPLLIPLFLLTAPVIQIVLILVVRDIHSPFVDFFSSIVFFALSSWYVSLIREANASIRENPLYNFDRKQMMLAYVCTFIILAVPLLLVYTVVIVPVVFSVAGITRLITTVTLFLLIPFITSTLVYDPYRKDGEQMTTTLFFGGGCIGLFVGYFGYIFPLLVFTAFMLKEWKLFASPPLSPSPSVNGEGDKAR